MSESTQAKGLTGTQMADLIGVDPKDFRRFVRAFERANGRGDALPGSGRRYAFDASHADAWAEAYRTHDASKGRVTMGAPVTDDEADA